MPDYTHTPHDSPSPANRPPLEAPRETLDDAAHAIGARVAFGLLKWGPEGFGSVAYGHCPACNLADSLALTPKANGAIDANCFVGLCHLPQQEGGAGRRAFRRKVEAALEIRLSRNPRQRPREERRPANPKGIDADAPMSVEGQIGEWMGREVLAESYVYVADEAAWWRYDGLVWRPMSEGDPRLMDDVYAKRYSLCQALKEQGYGEPAQYLAETKGWESLQRPKSDFFKGLRLSLAGDEPIPEDHHIATPEGVFDLRSGKIHPHAARFNVRAVTAGSYAPEALVDGLEAFNRRFAPVFEPEIQKAYLELVSLHLTGRGPDHRGIVMVIGRSGSGKGGAVNVLLKSLGDYAASVTRAWLNRRQFPTDIDAVTAGLIERRPRVIAIDEVGEDSKIDTGFLMSASGNGDLTARRPYGPTLTGSLTAGMWLTAVDVPKMPRGSGIERRLAVLPTLGSLEGVPVDGVRPDDPDLMAYVVTRACQFAAEVYDPSYRPPAGDPGRKAATLAEMDPLADWLDRLFDDASFADGQTMADVVSAATEAGYDNANNTNVGRAVKFSEKWHSFRVSTRKPTRIYRQTGWLLDGE